MAQLADRASASTAVLATQPRIGSHDCAQAPANGTPPRRDAFGWSDNLLLWDAAGNSPEKGDAGTIRLSHADRTGII